jgi:tetratricopeptide (TPR) repeat protein
VISLTRAESDRSSELVVLSNLGSSLHDVGKVSAALLPLREALRLKEQYPELRTGALFVQVQIGNMERALGHYPEALRWLEQGRAILGEYVPKVVGAAHIGLAHLWLDLGSGARPPAARAGAGDPLRSAMFQPSPTCCVTRTALAQGRRDAATEALPRRGPSSSTRRATRSGRRPPSWPRTCRSRRPPTPARSRSRAKPDGCT